MQRCEDKGVPVIANAVLTPLGKQHREGDQQSAFTTAEECLTFTLRQPGVRMVLCGTRNAEHLNTNVEIVRRLAAK